MSQEAIKLKDFEVAVLCKTKICDIAAQEVVSSGHKCFEDAFSFCLCELGVQNQVCYKLAQIVGHFRKTSSKS